MIDTIEKALNPLSLVIFILGCGNLRYSDQPRFLLSIFYIFVVWSVYAYVFYYVMILFSPRDIFKSIVASFVTLINLFVTLISIIVTIRKHEKFRICIRKLSLVDDTFEELGTPKEYHRTRYLMKCAFATLFLTSCTSWTLDYLVWMGMYNDARSILIPFVMEYTVHTNTITDIMFILLLRHIGTRLDKINNHIKQLSEIEDNRLRCKWKQSFVVSSHYVRSAENHKRVLWTVMHLHAELCRIARCLNSFFGMQMTLQMISYFVILIGMFHFQYHTILYVEKFYEDNTILKVFLCSNMWFIIFLIKLILLNHICESVSTKAQKTKSMIHKLTNIICFAEVRKEICQFVLQISLRPLKFSGMGLFYFGYDFIRKFFVSILTAIIFMAQVDFPAAWTEIHDRNNVTYYD